MDIPELKAGMKGLFLGMGAFFLGTVFVILIWWTATNVFIPVLEGKYDDCCQCSKKKLEKCRAREWFVEQGISR